MVLSGEMWPNFYLVNPHAVDANVLAKAEVYELARSLFCCGKRNQADSDRLFSSAPVPPLLATPCQL